MKYAKLWILFNYVLYENINEKKCYNSIVNERSLILINN